MWWGLGDEQIQKCQLSCFKGKTRIIFMEHLPWLASMLGALVLTRPSEQPGSFPHFTEETEAQ